MMLFYTARHADAMPPAKGTLKATLKAEGRAWHRLAGVQA
jgi:hypothetical protein